MNVVDYLFDNNCNPEKDLLLGQKENASFSEINEKSLEFSNWLKDNYGENNRIVIISPNSLFFIITYLGIMKSGNVCIPLNPAIEQNNLSYICDISDISLAFVSSKIKHKYDFPDIPVLDEVNLEDRLNKYNPVSVISSNHFDETRLAQILFTSGSTGEPKGVMLSHKNIISNTTSIINYLSLTENDVIAIVLPFYYCYGLSLLHTHIKAGGSIVLNNSFIFIGSVLNDLKKYQCTGFSGVPSHFQILLRKSNSFRSTQFPHLRYVTQAGGKLHNIFIEEFVKSFPEIQFYVMYGQTEATARLSYLPPDLVLDKIGSIGKGIPGVTLDIVNSNSRPVQVGEIGEVVAKGDNIMLGYLNDPEGNKNTLKNGWLHTGDLAQKDEDGFIYLFARQKEIIKVGGKRVSPKEIEEVILSVPFILSCRIRGESDDILGEAIKAEVILSQEMDHSEVKKQIIKTCREKLALFKVPTIIEIEDKIKDPLKMSK